MPLPSAVRRKPSRQHLCTVAGRVLALPVDAAENTLSLLTGCRIISSYPLGTDRVWLISEADRSLTTLLLPSEY